MQPPSLMSAFFIFLGTLLSAAIGGYVTYRVKTIEDRSKSNETAINAKKTDGDLSHQFIQDLTTDNKSLRDEVKGLREEIAAVHTELKVMRAEAKGHLEAKELAERELAETRRQTAAQLTEYRERAERAEQEIIKLRTELEKERTFTDTALRANEVQVAVERERQRSSRQNKPIPDDSEGNIL
jgi:chromosome segregation ATPase